MYDYLVIGAGLFGSIFAYEANKIGKSVIVIDKRDHIGGNCFTHPYDDFYIHKYGPHIFHTSSKYIWDYINQFTSFNNYSHRAKSFSNNKLYSMPINLMTINQIWPNVITPEQAKNKIASEIIPCENPKNLEDHILSMVGPTLYELLIKGYTTKQWGRDPKLLPASIIKRLPIRYTLNDRYYHDTDIYEGIPVNGYTPIFEKLLSDVKIELGVDFFKDRKYWENKANRIIFSGQIDQYFDYMFGDLEYRSLNFESYGKTNSDFQGTSIISYPDLDVNWTRIVQHKHFTNSKSQADYITYEFSKKYNKEKNETPYYPINDDDNNKIYKDYKEYALRECPNLIIGGRLGNYRYYDMDITIGNALKTAEKELAG